MVLIYLIFWLHHIDHTALQRSHNLQHLYTASKLFINIDDFFDFIFCLRNYIFNAGWVLLVCAYVILQQFSPLSDQYFWNYLLSHISLISLYFQCGVGPPRACICPPCPPVYDPVCSRTNVTHKSKYLFYLV